MKREDVESALNKICLGTIATEPTGMAVGMCSRHRGEVSPLGEAVDAYGKMLESLQQYKTFPPISVSVEVLTKLDRMLELYSESKGVKGSQEMALRSGPYHGLQLINWYLALPDSVFDPVEVPTVQS